MDTSQVMVSDAKGASLLVALCDQNARIVVLTEDEYIWRIDLICRLMRRDRATRKISIEISS